MLYIIYSGPKSPTSVPLLHVKAQTNSPHSDSKVIWSEAAVLINFDILFNIFILEAKCLILFLLESLYLQRLVLLIKCISDHEIRAYER